MFDFTLLNKLMLGFNKSIQFVVGHIWWIIIPVGLYYLGRFGWRSYKKYIFGTEWDVLGQYFLKIVSK